MYHERAFYPHFDVALGNMFGKIHLVLVNPDLIKEFFSGNLHYKYPKYKKMLSGIKVLFG